jgi:signal transduction histidine kinase
MVPHMQSAATRGVLSRPSVWLIIGLAWASATIVDFELYRVGASQPYSRRDVIIGLTLEGLFWLYWIVVAPLIVWVARRFPLRPLSRSAIAVHLTVAIATVVAHTALTTILGRAAGYGANETPFTTWLHITALSGLFQIFLYGTIAGVITVVDSAAALQQREVRDAMLSAELASARLESLLLQLQPHFILNTLNTVAILMRESSTTYALRVVTDLGGLLQGMLRNVGQQEHTLEDEMVFVERYLDIAATRFADRLSIAIDVANGLDQAAVPRYVLQPIVENALRHGIGRSEQGGRVAITAWRTNDQLWLRVADDGPGLPSNPEAGIGLANVRSRLDHLYGARCGFTIDSNPTGTAATICLPFRLYAEQP